MQMHRKETHGMHWAYRRCTARGCLGEDRQADEVTVTHEYLVRLLPNLFMLMVQWYASCTHWWLPQQLFFVHCSAVDSLPFEMCSAAAHSVAAAACCPQADAAQISQLAGTLRLKGHQVLEQTWQDSPHCAHYRCAYVTGRGG
jgi:hypothetical protein